ncbi:MAG: NfeD family protein [Motiliproteus sp.]
MAWEMEVWQLWLLAGMILAALEMLGLGFVALALGVSCGAGALAAAAGGSLTMQVGSSAVAAMILIPLLVRLFKQHRSGADSISLAGEAGSAGQTYTLVEQQGRLGIRIKGDFFPVESADANALSVNQTIIVQHFSGITAIVALAPINSVTKD